MRRLIRGLAGAAFLGGALGGATHLAAAPPSARAAAALIVVLVAAPAVAAASSGGAAPSWPVVGRAVAATLLCAGAAETVAAAAFPSPGAALVPAAAVVLVLGITALLRRLGVRDDAAVFLAAAAPLVLAGSIFVADPYVEGGPGSSGTTARAERVIALNPVPAMLALDGGAGFDWQTSRWLYDGPGPGTSGLSVIGQSYPAIPPAPWTWALVTAGLGGALLLAGRRRRERRDG